MKLFVSGLVNVETYLRVHSFPVAYYPVDYPFFGVNTIVSGVGYNVSMASRALGDSVTLASLIGKDAEAERIIKTLDNERIDRKYIFQDMTATPVSVVLYESGEQGRRQMYCDLKNVQELSIDPERVASAIKQSDMCVLCNTNFSRPLISVAKSAGKRIATDVHVINNVRDPFNRDFMANADVLFVSDEDIPCSAREFLKNLKTEYSAEVIVVNSGEEGVLLYERKTDGVMRLPVIQHKGSVHTTCDGDALFASFNHYYAEYSAVEALKRAQIFSANIVLQSGGIVGYPTEERVEQIYGSYEMKKVNVG